MSWSPNKQPELCEPVYGTGAHTRTVTPTHTAPSSDVARIDLLGRAEVILGDNVRHVLVGKSAALVALTAFERSPSRRSVAGMLWPESLERLARNNLRTLMHRLTRQLGQELLGSGEHLCLAPQVTTLHTLNADEIVAVLAAGGASRCKLLADVGLLDLEQFQSWLGDVRHRVNQQQLAALDDALAAAMGGGQWARAINFARACVVLEPLSERWHRRLMQTQRPAVTARPRSRPTRPAKRPCSTTSVPCLMSAPAPSTYKFCVGGWRSARNLTTSLKPPSP